MGILKLNAFTLKVKMEENETHFYYLMHFRFRKAKSPTVQTEKKNYVPFIEGDVIVENTYK